MVKLVVIAASPRPDGNTDQVAEFIKRQWIELGEKPEDVDIITLRNYRIQSCGHSGSCGDCNLRSIACGFNDDMPTIIEKMVQADAIIYGTPVYGFGTAHLMQQFIERAGVGFLKFGRPLENKIAGLYVTGHRFNLSAVHDQILNNLLLNRFVVPGSGFPALVHGGAPGHGMEDLKGMDSVMKMVDRVHSFAAAFEKYGLFEELLMDSTNEADRTYQIRTQPAANDDHQVSPLPEQLVVN